MTWIAIGIAVLAAATLALVAVALYFMLRKTKEGFDASPSLLDLREFSSLNQDAMQFISGVMSGYSPVVLNEINQFFDKLTPAERKGLLKNASALGAAMAKLPAMQIRQVMDTALQAGRAKKKTGK